MKKTKIIAISLLGLLLLIPFMRPSMAQVPSYVGLAEGDHEEWDFSVYVGAAFETWDPWFDDNMTDHWAEVFGHGDLDNMSSVWETAGKVPVAPQVTFFLDVDSIQPDLAGFDANFDEVVTPDETWASPGRTLVNMSTTSGSFMDFPGWPYWRYFENGTTIFISNTSAGFAEDVGYGVLATSAMWTTNLWNFAEYGIYNINTLFFAPKNANWTEFAAECNTGLENTYDIIANYSYDLTVYNLSNGFKLSSPVMGFGNNSETINITTTYDANGKMTLHKFEYGTTLLYDVTWVESDAPVITDSPSDFSVDHDYTGETLSWTATDANPNQFGVTRNGTGVLIPAAWTSGVAVQYAIPDDLPSGDHLFEVGFTDDRGKVTYDQVIMTVGPHPVPPIPGYEPLLVIGFLSAATIGIVFLMKKKK
ncbi:MAG: hypothetical protein ACXAB8_15550 [Promethearchaeota archaeon]|jgi:hypothetical protein